jgi:hypothetical protein
MRWLSCRDGRRADAGGIIVDHAALSSGRAADFARATGFRRRAASLANRLEAA